MTRRLSDIAEVIGGTLRGDGSIEISGVAALDDAEEGTIAFLSDRRQSGRAMSSRASAIIVPPGFDLKERPSIVSDNPQLAFIDVVTLFYPAPHSRGIDPRSYLEKGVKIGDNVTAYPNVYVGEGAVLGDRVVLYPGVFVGSGSRIGCDSVLHPNVVVNEGTEIGERVIIHGGAIIGADGYGFVWNGEKHVKIPHVGRVVIGDDVEIGANCTVDRATLGKTEIKRGTKIDNLVHIAHNCTIGEDSLFAAQVGLSGSVNIGRNVVMAGQVGVADHVNIGSGVVIGGKSGITKDIKDGARVSGYPPLPHIEWMKVQKSVEKLPEMRKLLKEISKKIEKMEAQDA